MTQEAKLFLQERETFLGAASTFGVIKCPTFIYHTIPLETQSAGLNANTEQITLVTVSLPPSFVLFTLDHFRY